MIFRNFLHKIQVALGLSYFSALLFVGSPLLADGFNSELDWIEAIAKDPDSDELRLDFADWLSERRQTTRADFIRTQIAFANTDSSSEQARLELAVKEFTLNHWEEIAPNFPQKYKGMLTFERGNWVLHWDAVNSEKLQIAEDLLSKHPMLMGLELKVSFLRSDDLYTDAEREQKFFEMLKNFFRSNSMKRISVLRVNGITPQYALDAVTQSVYLQRNLRTLAIIESPIHIQSKYLKEFVENGNFTNLKDLRIPVAKFSLDSETTFENGTIAYKLLQSSGFKKVIKSPMFSADHQIVRLEDSNNVIIKPKLWRNRPHRDTDSAGDCSVLNIRARVFSRLKILIKSLRGSFF